MRKTLNINLGGFAFIIDENAFDLLHNYLEALKRKFNNAAEREEILNDIEGRIAELLNQKLADRREVVSSDDVQSIMDALGKPEDIAGEEAPEETGSTAKPSGPTATEFTPINKKRLFRDPDDAKIGGVISGLCHYFGVRERDVIWARVVALVLIPVTSFSIVLLYLLLLVVIPKANTAAEKLQMKGEPININTIEKEIREATNRASDSVHKMFQEQNIFERIWDIFLSLFRAFGKLFSIFAIFIAMILLIAVAAAFAAVYILGTSGFHQVANLMVSSSSTITFFSFGFLLFFATPLIAILYGCLRFLLGSRSQARWINSGLMVLWIAGLILLLATGYKIGVNFKQEGTVRRENALMQPTRGNLFVQLSDSTGKKVTEDDEEGLSSFNIDEDGVRINGVDFKDVDLISLGKPSLQLMPSENDSFYVQEVITAQGRNRTEAERNAEMVIYPYSQTDTVLHMRPHYYIGKTAKYRAQDIKIRIAIPKGKKISFASNIDMWHVTVKGDSNYDDTYFANTTWTVENGKVKCIAGENHKNAGEEKTGSTGKKEKKNAKTDDEDSDDKSDKKDKSDQDF
jgi:phage shock protein C